MNEPPRRFDRVRGLREALTSTGAGINLSTHLAGPIPAEAMAAVHESDEMELRIGRAGPDRDEDMMQRQREARAVAAAVLAASPERIVLTHGVAEAARLVALEVLERREGAGQRVLLLEGLDRIVAAAIRDVADVAGAGVEVLAEAPRILPADVAFVAMAHVDHDGRLADVPAVADAAHKAGARLLVDAGLSLGALPTDVEAMRADFVVADTHRWLLGPDAVCIAWVSPHMGAEVPEWLRQASSSFARGSLLALSRSVGWLLMYVELPWAIDRTVGLADQLYADLAAIHGVQLVASADAHGAVAAFRVVGWDAESVAEELGRSIFAIVEADAETDVVRASVAAWNRESELERFVQRVAEIAAHTPQTLPRRPSLTVISGPIGSRGGCVSDGQGVPPREVRHRSEWEIRWRQARNAPPPVVRAVLANVAVATVGGIILLLSDWLASHDMLPTFVLDLGPLLYVTVVIVSGTVFTYLWVELPTGVPGQKRRSAWSGVLGFFASIPIVYLALVISFEFLRPLLP